MPPLFTIAVIAFNNLHLTKRCMEAVFRSEGRFEVIFVNNGSTDGTADYLSSLGTQVGVITNETNRGVGESYNQAIQYAHAPYFVTLNNDMEILEPDWLSKMRQKFIDDPKMAIVGFEGTCQSLDEQGFGHPGTVLDYVEGSCMMIRTNLARRYGLFDPAYRFGYCEDSDLSLRMRKRGYHIARVPINHRHEQGATSRMVANTIDIDGYHLINDVTLVRRWKKYLTTKSFNEKIAIRRSGAFGDVIQATPLLRELKKQNAHCEIHFFTDCGVVLEGNPDVHAIHPEHELAFESVSKEYDRVIDLDGAYESRDGHIMNSYAAVAEIELPDRRMHVYPNSESRTWSKERIEGKWVVMHPHSGQVWHGRNWPYFNWLAENLRSKGYKVCLIGKGNDSVANDLDLRGQTNFHQMMAIVERSTVFVGVDSAPMNVAQASLVATVGIFGAMNPNNILIPIPFISAAQAPLNDCGCLGCHTMYDPRPTGSPGRCVRGTDVCMEKLTVEMVIEKIEHVLAMRYPYSETAKIRTYILPHLTGSGIDIGCHRDPIKTDCVCFDDDPWPEVNSLGDARKMPFPDNHFDWVYSSHLIEDIDDTESVLVEWARIVKPGGKLIVATPHPALFTGFNSEHVHDGFTPEELVRQVNLAGCDVIEYRVEAVYSTIVVGIKR